MKCLKCDKELKTSNIGGVEIDECKKCNSIWFDEDELRKAKDQTDQDLNWMDFEIWKHGDKFQIGEESLICPKCSEKMVPIKYDNTGVEIDYCRECKGTWLEGGEFEKIIDELTKELLAKPSSEYLKATLQEAKEIITGPEGFISEWKDFLTVLRFFKTRLHVERL
ncbi:zf-TFIIB domain-containing protein [Acidobacteriota bacterium]